VLAFLLILAIQFATSEPLVLNGSGGVMRTVEKGEGLGVESLGGESREAFSKADFWKRLDRYGKARGHSLQFAQFLTSQDEHKLARLLNDCGNYATFRDYFTIGQIRMESMCTCKKHLICNLCAIRRGAKALRIYLARVTTLLDQDPALKPYLVTLTVKNGLDLGERFAHLANSVRKYHKRRHGTRQTGEVRKAHSAVWSYEFTNKGNGWHPHVHSIWLCHTPPDPVTLSSEWRQLTGDSFIVDSRPLDMVDPVASFCEVFKYAIKFADLANADRLHAHKTLKGKRLQDSFGDLRGLDVELTEGDDLLDDLPFIRRLFHYVEGHGYVESSTSKTAA